MLFVSSGSVMYCNVSTHYAPSYCLINYTSIQWGEKAELLKESTSVIPFAAIISGKQQLPADYYKEFLRLPYFTIVVGSIVAYLAHPYMQAGATLLHW